MAEPEPIVALGKMREALEAFMRAFTGADPARSPLREQLAARLMLFPYDDDRLALEQYAAVRVAAQAEGDRQAFVADTQSFEGIGWFDRRHRVWSVPLDDYDAYTRAVDPSGAPQLQSALFSPSGAWGVLLNDDFSAIVGGSQRFRELVLDALPNPRPRAERFLLGAELDLRLIDLLGAKEGVMVEAWLKMWAANRESGGYDVAWIPQLLEHLFGRETAMQIVRISGWPSDR